MVKVLTSALLTTALAALVATNLGALAEQDPLALKAEAGQTPETIDWTEYYGLNQLLGAAKPEEARSNLRGVDLPKFDMARALKGDVAQRAAMVIPWWAWSTTHDLRADDSDNEATRALKEDSAQQAAYASGHGHGGHKAAAAALVADRSADVSIRALMERALKEAATQGGGKSTWDVGMGLNTLHLKANTQNAQAQGGLEARGPSAGN